MAGWIWIGIVIACTAYVAIGLIVQPKWMFKTSGIPSVDQTKAEQRRKQGIILLVIGIGFGAFKLLQIFGLLGGPHP
jgi:hypothetical protein